jgi:AcrR family transcriptional regulator
MSDTATAPKRRGSYAKSEETRANILDAALTVFAEAGYHKGSIREVAKRVGMSEPGLLHHFRTKSALLEAVLTLRDEKSYAIVPLDGDDGRASINGLVALAAHNASVPGVVELFCILSAEATSTEHPAHAYFANRYRWTRENLQRTFEILHRDGELLPGVTPLRAALSTIAVMDGLQVQWLLDRGSIDMAHELRSFLATLTSIPLEQP